MVLTIYPDELVQIVSDKIASNKGKITLNQLWDISGKYFDLSDKKVKQFVLSCVILKKDIEVYCDGAITTKNVTDIIGDANHSYSVGITEDSLWTLLTGYTKRSQLLEILHLNYFSKLPNQEKKGSILWIWRSNPYINIRDHLATIVEVVKRSKNGIRQIIDLKRELKFDKEKRLSKAFIAAIAWLDEKEYLKKVLVVSPKNPAIKIRCVKYVKDIPDSKGSPSFEYDSNSADEDSVSDSKAAFEDEDLVEGLDNFNATDLLQNQGLVMEEKEDAVKNEVLLNRFYPLQNQTYDIADKLFTAQNFQKLTNAEDEISVPKGFDELGKSHTDLKTLNEDNFVALNNTVRFTTDSDGQDIFFWHGELKIPPNSKKTPNKNKRKRQVKNSTDASVAGNISNPKRIKLEQHVSTAQEPKSAEDSPSSNGGTVVKGKVVNFGGFSARSLRSLQRQRAILKVMNTIGGVAYLREQFYESVSKYMGSTTTLDKKTVRGDVDLMVESEKLGARTEPNYEENRKKFTLVRDDTLTHSGNDLAMSSMIQREISSLKKTYTRKISASTKDLSKSQSDDYIRTVIRSILIESPSTTRNEIEALKNVGNESIDNVIMDMAKEKQIYLHGSKLECTDTLPDILENRGNYKDFGVAFQYRCKVNELLGPETLLLSIKSRPIYPLGF
ncbi:transcription factor TFIIIC subunit [Saccharomyces cerevisiae]|nr:transcription factor TFIIIC subunit [Saccharomyces cerevisiae]